MHPPNDWASLPTSQIQDTAKEVIGRELSEEELMDFYNHMESDLNDAIDTVLRDSLESWNDSEK